MEQKTEIDDNLYSRQKAVYGAETMQKLVQLKVFLHGLRGVGIETAKNLILAGPASVTLHDDDITQIADLGSNFNLTEQHVGKVSRADASAPQLSELNNYVKIHVHKGDITNEILAQHDIIVITDFYDKDKLIEWNQFCRSNGKGFVYTGNLGLYGFGFIDYGDKHIIIDKNGEEVRNCIIVNITQDEQPLVVVHEDKRHGFEDNDWVSFREVQGMDAINGQLYQIEVKSSYSFLLKGDTRNFKPYTREGIVEQVKQPFDIQFRSLKDALVNPVPPGMQDQGMYMCDWEKFGYPEQLHVAFNALLEFVAQNKNALPALNNEEDANKLVELAQKINDSNKTMDIEGAIKLEEVNKDLVSNVARFARANISPVASFWGGIIAQEIVKYTGKFTPLRQWLHCEFFESLPETQVDRKPTGCRYDDMISIFGKETMDKLSTSKVFMIGAGALGCEFLKQFALMGMAVDKKGIFTVTDNDNIEISNLNRQFLFRKSDVSHSKSERAALAVKKMNPSFNVTSHKNLVSPETEDLFDDKFWNGKINQFIILGLDFVVNAVDNVKARLFVDGRCVWFGKALFESGTLGTKCNSQVIIPKQTQSYGDSQDPPEDGIPLCTLKNFPNQIEHCIQWSRDYFEGLFVEGPNDAIQYIKSPQKFIEQKCLELKQKTGLLRGKLETVKKLAIAYLGGTYQHFIELARLLFEEIHHNQIVQLLYAFPLDHKTENGQFFWSGPKRPPTPLKFDINDPQHSTANIFANIFGLPFNNDVEAVKQLIKKVNVPVFQPKKISIKVDDNDTTEEKVEDDEEVAEKLANELKSALNPTEFEKDDPANWHIEFVSAVANLRGRNYNIKEVSKFQVKIIAGKIIPALATTTAMVVGSVGLEIIKYVLGKKIDKMKNAFMNIALPLWLFSEPLPAIQTKDKEYDQILMGPVKAIPYGWTTWDKIDVQGPKTIQQIIDHFQNTYKVKPTIMSSGKFCIYNSYQADNEERLGWDIGEAIVKIGQKPIPSFKVFLELEVSCETIEDMIDVVMPTVKYAYKG